MRQKRITQGLCVLGGVVVTFVDSSISRAQSLIFESLLDKYGASKADTGWVFGINMLVLWGGAWLPMWISSRIGCRSVVILGGFLNFTGLVLTGFMPSLPYVYVTYGVILGLGCAACWDPAFIILDQNFDKGKGKAVGIAAAGDPLGGLIMAPIVQLLFETYGFSGAIMVLGAFNLNNVLAGFLMRSPKKEKEGAEQNGEASPIKQNTELNNIKELSTDMRENVNENEQRLEKEQKKESKWRTKIKEYKKSWAFLKNARFLGLVLCITIYIFARGSVNTFMAGLAEAKGISRMQSALILSVSSGLSLPASLAIGFIFDIKIFHHQRALLFGVLMSLYGATSALLPLANGVVLYAIVWTISNILGNAYRQHISVMGDLIGSDNLMKAVGLTGIVRAAFSFSGPVLGGFLRDRTGSYDQTYYLCGTACAVSGILMLLPEAWNKVRSSQSNRGSSQTPPKLIEINVNAHQ